MSRPTTAHEPSSAPAAKRTRKPKLKTDFALADEATRALADIDARAAKITAKYKECMSERGKLIDSLTPAVKKLLGLEPSTGTAE